MRRVNRLLLLGLMIGAAGLSGCQKHTANQEYEHPAVVEHIDGSELSRVTLTPKAMERLDVKTAEVSEQKGSRNEAPQKSVPYAALLYDAHGTTFVYKSPKERVFVRHSIDVDYIEGDVVYLKDGPETGTQVATIGVAEIYGTEFEVGH